RWHRDRALLLAGRLLDQGLVSLVWAVIEAPHRGWTDGLVLAALAASLVFGLLFVQRQLHTRDPLLDIGLSSQPASALGSLPFSAAFSPLFGLIFPTTNYPQSGRGGPAITPGLVMLPLALGLVIGSGSSHKITAKLGAPTQLFVALTTVALV